MTLYECDQLPTVWVVERDGDYSIVPAVHRGWDLRSPFRGYRESLRPVPSFYAIGLGIPRDQGARLLAS